MKMKLIAHRGYAVEAPQNSLAAFEAAGKLGYWAIETDVHKTRDGVLVCCHDATVDHMFDGSGRIADMTWDELRTLRMRKEPTQGMPLFSEYLDICKRYGAVAFIETKTADVAEVLDMAFAHLPIEQIVLSSIDFSHLLLARAHSPEVFIHHIFSSKEHIEQLEHMLPAGLSLNETNLDQFDPGWVTYVHSRGLKLCLRAGDDPKTVERMIALGLDYIPTNRTKP